MAEQATPNIKRPSSQIGALTLVNVDIEYDPELENDNEIEASFHAEITPPEAVGIEENSIADTVVFQAHMRIGKGRKVNEEFSTFISAIYFCAMRYKDASDAEVIELAKFVAQTTIWSNFTSLAAIVTQQMRAEFPVLPPHPGRVAVISQEDETESNIANEG